MAEWSGFFDAHKLGDSWDRVYLAEDFAKFFAPLIGNGVFAGKSNELQVFQSVPAGMSVVLSSGQSWIEGYGYTNDSDLTIPIAPADGVLGRIDRIVNQWSAVDRQIRTVWKKGIPAVNPVAPDLRWDADYKELNLCTLDVSAGLAAITQDKIRDTRADSSVCGWVTGLIDQVDTATLFAQWEAAYEKEFTEQKIAWEEFFEDIQVDLGIPVPSPDKMDSVLSVGVSGKYVLSDRYLKKDDVGNLPMDHHQIKDLAAPVADSDAVNLGYANTHYAPTGFGLEGSVQTANLDAIHANGWYQCGTGTVGAPTGHRYVEYGTVFVINRWGNHTTQLYVTQPSDVVGSPLMLVRNYKEAEGTWSPWEWINPPMVLGAEYRTIERHNGLPVYTKLINCGVVTNGTTVAIDSSISVIRFAARSTNKVAYPFATPGSDYHRSAMVSSGGIEFACGTKAMNTDTVYCQIWYTK